jgi:hypothetical protein
MYKVSTYGGVDGLISFQATILTKTVMGLAKGHAGNATCNSAEANRAEAAKEAVLPRLRRLGGLGVDVLAGTGQDIVETILPLVEVVMVDGTVVVGIGLSWSSHCGVLDNKIGVKR